MDQFLGQIELFPYGFAPQDWTVCNGQLLRISENQALFSLLGTTYGGDGQTTFALPDLRNAALGQYNQYYIALAGIYPSRN
ncbi:phage tail protein [Clostridium formicaceticum]|uniref:Phage Tail Collar Domain protein n=1 Tax=Clostridium formicaceticum TaxID=1497 RepID=A0AAC9RMY0_9CLOT|nr:tail fiber protein [Clostridium formicaceticum]AOY77998.1 phage tail protein [Clostridium formicaceticum]ARE88629.1 Phage Tail Collar Domain protein [Clostridium formicaceticum]